MNCAHSVIELITQFWPDSIDILAPEKGIVKGLKPIFLWGQDDILHVGFNSSLLIEYIFISNFCEGTTLARL